MKIPRFAVVALVVLSSFAATGVAPTKTELENMYDKAFREFDANHYEEALKALDAIDVRQPDLAESQNLRGVVLMRQGQYDKAEAALRKALEIEPKFWNATFNLAEIPFLKKNWPEARNRFEALVAGNSDQMKGETALLIQYKVLLTFVLEGKGNMVDWIVNKFEDEKDSPALYYSNAAIALQGNNQKEAKDWMDAADKHYPASLNKLFAESFYEIGWLTKPAGETRAAIEVTSTAERAARMKADAQANFERAERAFRQRDLAGAISFLDLADEGAPNQASSLNLRGEIFMEDKKFDEAEQAFTGALAADPKFREAQYNLAQIPFKKKNYAQSRERLEVLFGQTPGGEKNQAAQLIKYKIFMTLLLEDKEAQAQQMMDQFKFTGDTPALYYAQAAWAFKHGNPDQGNDWIKSARKIYSPALNIVFADTFYDLGWLKRDPDTAPPTTALAQANAVASGPTPAMRFGATDSVTLPTPAGAPLGEATPAVVANASPAAVASPPIASSTASAMAASSPIAILAGSATPPVVPKATPAVAPKSAPAPVVAAVKNTPAPKAAVPAVLSASSAVSPAPTALAPARIREWSQPTFAEFIDGAAEPRNLLIGGLLLGGVAILGWLGVQQIRRQGSDASLYETSLPVTEPRFGGPAPAKSEERRVSREQLDGGPPKLSLKLQATEPALRKATLPSGTIDPQKAASDNAKFGGKSPVPKPAEPVTAAKAGMPATPPVDKNARTPVTPALPNEPKKPEPVAKVPLRDEKDISRAAAPKTPLVPLTPLPAKAAATSPPAIIVQPKATPIEPKKLAAMAEVKTPPVTPTPPVRREEPVGQGQPVPHLAAASSIPPSGTAATPSKPAEKPAGSSTAPATPAAKPPLLAVGTATPAASPIAPAGASPAKTQPPIPASPITAAGQKPSTPVVTPVSTGIKLPAPNAPTVPSAAKPAAPVVPPATPAALKSPVPIPPVAPLNKPATPPALPAPVANRPGLPAVPATPAAIKPAAPAVPPVGPAAAKQPVPVPPTAPANKPTVPVVPPPPATATKPSAPVVPPAVPAAAKPPVPSPAAAPFTKPATPPAPVPLPASNPTVPAGPTATPAAKPPTLAQPFAPVIKPPFGAPPIPTPVNKPMPQTPVRMEPEKAAVAAIAGAKTPPQSPVETPSFASKIITTKPTTPPSTTPAIMPEPTPITAINEPRRAPVAGGAGAPATAAPGSAPAGSLQTAVQLTFSLEIASLQLTPNFKMGSLQLKPISKIVSMRLAPSTQPQPAMNLQVTFELSSVQLGAGASLGTVRLTPSVAQRPTPITSPSFEISGLQLISSAAASPVQLTPTQQGGQASVLMTASFQIATVEFSPSFEIASVVLNSSSKNVAVQLPGTGPSSIEGAPVFEIGNVQLGGNNEIGMIQLNPLGGIVRR